MMLGSKTWTFQRNPRLNKPEIIFLYTSDKVVLYSETVGFCIFSTERKRSGEHKLGSISI